MTDNERGPQITARPGTKRHLRQTIARANFWAIIHSSEAAKTRRLKARINDITTELLTIMPPQESA